jgi:hypothetical protein
LLDDNPAVFINNAFKYFQIHQQQPFEWFEQIYGNHIFDTIMAEHNQIVEDYQNDLREYEDKASMNDVSLYKIFNKPFIDFLY